MGAGQAAQIAAALIAAGKPATMPIAIVESASLPESHTIFTTLALLPHFAGRLSGPTVILIGPQYRHARRLREAAPRQKIRLPRLAGVR